MKINASLSGYPEIRAHLKCNNMASLLEAKYDTCTATIQEPIIQSEKLTCACVMAFSRTSLFLDRLWGEFWISGKFHKPVSKTYRPRYYIFCLLITLVFLFDILYFECAHRYGGDSIFAGKSALKCV